MSAATRPHPALQARSRHTLERLLEAAESLLEEEGADAATARAIAERAGVSVGIVYRRFPDKDAVLRAVYERFFERSRQANEASFARVNWSAIPLAESVTLLVEGMVRGYRERRGLLRALLLYARTHEDREFRRRADELNGAVFRHTAKLLESRRTEVNHPDPAMAIQFAFTMVAFALRELLLSDDAGTRKLGFRQDEVPRELSRMVLGYLGVRTRSGS